ncbi:MAG: N-acetylmuramoyl-L-alanine amidase, partial [Lachnospiraceae bacterium]|nr:N-acetylmuramoyl-L-alanine amidase [Candidatus Equihabitans merdae]
ILQNRGYQVVMTRTDHSAQLSNIDRAEIANTSGAEIMVRIHANGVDDTSVKGALTFGPSSDNAYLSPELIASSQRLGTDVVNKFCERTGAQNRGYCEDDGLTGVNWTQIPVTYIEMGFMSNPDEDLLMADDNYQNLMAEGIANGIDAYFAGQ